MAHDRPAGAQRAGRNGPGLGVLAIVGVLGTLPPALHTEPGWPFPVRLDLATLTEGSRILLASLALAACAFAIGGVVAAAAGHYRRMAVLAAGLALCLAIGSLPLRLPSRLPTRRAITRPPSPTPGLPLSAGPPSMPRIAPCAMAQWAMAMGLPPPVCRS